jgi:hypothetical protein
MRLRLPLVLTSVVVAAVAVAACTNDEPEPETYFCVSGDVPDAGAGQPDAALCGQIVHDPQDCPPGCIAESLA